jgi:7-cyano-7-deazaguanine reductase
MDCRKQVIEALPGRFRNHGAFQEDRTITVAKSLIELLRPKWLRMGGY